MQTLPAPTIREIQLREKISHCEIGYRTTRGRLFGKRNGFDDGLKDLGRSAGMRRLFQGSKGRDRAGGSSSCAISTIELSCASECRDNNNNNRVENYLCPEHSRFGSSFVWPELCGTPWTVSQAVALLLMAARFPGGAKKVPTTLCCGPFDTRGVATSK